MSSWRQVQNEISVACATPAANAKDAVANAQVEGGIRLQSVLAAVKITLIEVDSEG